MAKPNQYKTLLLFVKLPCGGAISPGLPTKLLVGNYETGKYNKFDSSGNFTLVKETNKNL